MGVDNETQVIDAHIFCLAFVFCLRLQRFFGFLGFEFDRNALAGVELDVRLIAFRNIDRTDEAVMDLDLLRAMLAGTLVLMHDDRFDEFAHDLRR